MTQEEIKKKKKERKKKKKPKSEERGGVGKEGTIWKDELKDGAVFSQPLDKVDTSRVSRPLKKDGTIFR